MPMDTRYRDIFMKDLNDNLSNIDVAAPPGYVGVAFSVTFVHKKTWSEDLNRIQAANNPIVLISYPTQGQKYLERFFSDLGREIIVHTIDFVRGDETPDSFDLVNDANKATFTIDISENNIGYFEVYTDIPSGSTSRMKMIVKDNITKAIISKKIIYNLEILRGGWTNVKLVIPHWDTSKTLEITFEEFEYGTQSDGIRIYKNASLEHLIRTYYYKFRENKSQWLSAIMRFDIHAKDKTVESTPSGQFFSRERITNAINTALQNHIIQYWENLQAGAKYIAMVGESTSAELLDSEYEEKEQLDVKIGYLLITPLRDLKVIKKLILNQVNLL